MSTPSTPSTLTLPQRLDAYSRLVRLEKPIGYLLVLWPTLWGLWIAGQGAPSVGHVLIFVLGTILMRCAGCAINDWADRDFDGAVKRTAQRPLASGEITPNEALWVCAACTFAAALLLIPLNWPTRLWALPALAIALIYPFSKRFFPVPQAFLGVAFSMGIPMAFAALRGEVPAIAWALIAANFFWVIAFDTEYAMVDRNDDLKHGKIQTSAIFFGRHDLLAIGLSYLIFLAILLWVGQAHGFGGYYHGGLIVAAALCVQHLFMIRDRDRMRCFAAFRANNWVGVAIFVGIVLDHVQRYQAWPNRWWY